MVVTVFGLEVVTRLQSCCLFIVFLFFSVCFPTVFLFLFVSSSSFQYLLSLDLKMESYVLKRGKKG